MDAEGRYLHRIDTGEDVMSDNPKTAMTTQRVPLPRYKCHKEVEALKIADIVLHDTVDAGATITPAEPRYLPFFVSAEYVKKHNPLAGGYWVRYRDGYQSWSPASEFEDGYTRITE
jgi:hypothetical protein